MGRSFFLSILMCCLMTPCAGALNRKTCLTELEKPSDPYTEHNAFCTNSSLNEYNKLFAKTLVKKLRQRLGNATAGSPLVWADWGAGTARAQRDFFKSDIKGKKEKQIKLLAFSYKKPQNGDASVAEDGVSALAPKHIDLMNSAIAHGDIQYTETNLELPFKSNRKVDIATDVFGPLSYVKDLRQTLQNVIDSLNVDGELFVWHHAGRTLIQMGKRQDFTIGEFLATIPGLEVTFYPQVDFPHRGFSVRKTKASVTIPELKINDADYWPSRKPPDRTYRAPFVKQSK